MDSPRTAAGCDLSRPRVYLDHAATRYPKSETALRAMYEFSRDAEASAGRGGYRSAQEAAAKVTSLRREIAHWIGAEASEISLHAGGTEALNAAIFGLLREGDHVVTTAAEHNSVLRPLKFLADQGTIQWTTASVDDRGRVQADEVLRHVQSDTRLIACVHAANVTGTLQPIEAIGQKLRQSNAPRPRLLCDAAQTFGHLPIDVEQAGIDFLAAPGHKGGGGPLGTGMLYAHTSTHGMLRPTVLGGTGTRSESLQMPNDYPESFEAGSRNIPALAGWLAELQERRGDAEPRQVLERTRDQLGERASYLYETLHSVAGVNVIGEPAERVLPVASFTVDTLSAAEVAMILDTEFGIEVRSGMHCAALIHEAIGSPDDGTVRASCAETTTRAEIDQLANALREITA